MPSNHSHNLDRVLCFLLSPRSVLILFLFLAGYHHLTFILAIFSTLPKVLCWALFLYLLSIPFTQLYRQAHEMSFLGQPPHTYLYPNQPPPVPQAGHFLIGPPPFHPPQGHQWVVVPPTPTPPVPATWRLDPDLKRNERGEHVTVKGEIFRIPGPQPGTPPMMGPQGSPPLMPPPPNSPAGSYLGNPSPWTIPFSHPFFQGGSPLSSAPQTPVASPSANLSPSISPPPPFISRQNTQSSIATNPTTPPLSSSPILRPRTHSQSCSEEQQRPPIHFRHVHFLDGDTIIPAGAHSRPPSRYREAANPQSGTLETGPPMRGRSTTASAFSERELPETQDRGRARSRPTMTRTRTRTPSPYPGRVASSPREGDTPRGSHERGRAPDRSAGRGDGLTFSFGPTDTSMTGALNGDDEGEYPRWPECGLCQQKPATKKLGRDREVDACDACFIEALRAEHRVRSERASQ